MAATPKISDRPLIIPDQLLTFWADLWHTDVKKDHKGDYDKSIVNALLPGNFLGEAANPKTKDRLFTELIKNNGGGDIDDAYNKFQNALGLDEESGLLADIPSIQIKYTNYQYDYKYFNRPERPDGPDGFIEISKKINEFLNARDVLRYTDTSRGGSEFLCSYPDNKLLHANTREVESDPASKISYDSLKRSCQNDERTNSIFYYEDPTRNPQIITYPKWNNTLAENKALAAFYCNKTLAMKLKGEKNGKLDVQLTFYNSDNKLVEITEKMNIASSFTKLVSQIKQFLNIKTSKDLKEAIFISKHHGDIGQVLSPYEAKILKNKKNESINTGNYFCAFESYDVNPVLKAFSVGLDGIWFHTSTSTGENQKIVIFKRKDAIGADEGVFLEYLKTQVTAEKNKCIAYLTTCLTAIDIINTIRTRFIDKFNQEFAVYATNANAWAAGVRGEGNLNKRYEKILQRACQYAILSKSLPKDALPAYVPADMVEIEAIDPEEKTPEELKGYLNLIYEKRKKYVFPEEQLNFSQRIFTVDGDLVSTTIQKEIAVISDKSYTGFSKKTMTTMWTFINLKNNRSRIVGFEPKLITGYALKSIHLIVNSFKEFNKDFPNLFLNFLKASVSTDAEITERLTVGLGLIKAEQPGVQRELLKGGRRTRRKQKGGQWPALTAVQVAMEENEKRKRRNTRGANQQQMLQQISIKEQILIELLNDLKLYFTLVLDNLASPDNILIHSNTFLKSMYGIELDFTASGNLTGGGTNEEEEALFERGKELRVEDTDETFFDKQSEDLEFATLSPTYTHLKDLIDQMCKEFSQMSTRSGLLKQRNNLYNLLYVIQQFYLILNLKIVEGDETPEEQLIQQVKELKDDFDNNNYFSNCVGWDKGMKALFNSKEFLELKPEVFRNLTDRLIRKSKSNIIGILEGENKKEKIKNLLEAEVQLAAANNKNKVRLEGEANAIVPEPRQKIYGISLNVLPLEMQRNIIIPAGAQMSEANEAIFNDLKEDNLIVTWEALNKKVLKKDLDKERLNQGIFQDRSTDERIHAADPLYETIVDISYLDKLPQKFGMAGGGARRKTQRRRKNENKKRRTVKSKHGRFQT